MDTHHLRSSFCSHSRPVILGNETSLGFEIIISYNYLKSIQARDKRQWFDRWLSTHGNKFCKRLYNLGRSIHTSHHPRGEIGGHREDML